ncbi:MAG TPA: TetR family transcriptional regulator [Xanthomonadaceae bacterium]|nr:TetR family transcriptional regulator [Xanthomonadaceae bacterium]
MGASISREQIVAAAFRLLDEVGIDGVSLRKVACGLGIRAPSLYWHFKSKQALVDAMADALIGDVARAIPAGQSWRATLQQIARESRQGFKSHRDGARVYAGTFVASENVLRLGEATISALVGAGVTVAFAATTAFDLMYYVLGFVIEEQSLPADRGEIERVRKLFMALAQERFPYCWQARHVLAEPAFDPRFEKGLDLLLDGVEQHIARTTAAPG